MTTTDSDAFAASKAAAAANKNPLVFIVDAVLFDMDGTLVDSIAAVEKAWGDVAEEIGKDRDAVIAATHGKRAIDNLKQFKPELKGEAEVEAAVQHFEETILANADEFKRRQSFGSTGSGSRNGSRRSSAASSRRPSGSGLRPAFGGLSAMQSITGKLQGMSTLDGPTKKVQPKSDSGKPLTGADVRAMVGGDSDDIEEHDPYDIEDEVVDQSVRILPGVRRVIDSIPAGRYAVATSGAKTYAYGAMTRVGIVPPPVTITADDKRLKAGKPAPDPFLLAAECLGFDCAKCLVFEDSPSGIIAAVASKATTIAVCTSHPRNKISSQGAHYVLDTMDCVSIESLPDGRLKVIIDYDAPRTESQGDYPTPADIYAKWEADHHAELAEIEREEAEEARVVQAQAQAQAV